MLEEQTVPKDSFDLCPCASTGGTPGGVDGRGRRGALEDMLVLIRGSDDSLVGRLVADRGVVKHPSGSARSTRSCCCYAVGCSNEREADEEFVGT